MPRLTYNSPVVLTLALSAIAVHALDAVTPGRLTEAWFSLPGRFQWDSAGHWLRLFTYPLGHADAGHLMGNLVMWLVIGPLVEEKYGSPLLLEMGRVPVAGAGRDRLAADAAARLMQEAGLT